MILKSLLSPMILGFPGYRCVLSASSGNSYPFFPTKMAGGGGGGGALLFVLSRKRIKGKSAFLLNIPLLLGKKLKGSSNRIQTTQ